MFTGMLALAMGGTIAWISPQQETDHLIPSEAPLAGFEDDRYRAALHRCLLPDGWRHATMVTMPSFNREWAVYLTRPRNGEGYEVVSRGMKQVLWGNSVAEKDTFGTTCVEHNSRHASVVTESRVPVTAETAAMLIQLWRSALLRSRFPATQKTSGFDGVTFVFSDFEVGVGYRHGEAWSPMEGTRLRSLVSVGEAMARLASSGAATLQQRAALERELQALVMRARVKFEPEVPDQKGRQE